MLEFQEGPLRLPYLCAQQIISLMHGTFLFFVSPSINVSNTSAESAFPFEIAETESVRDLKIGVKWATNGESNCTRINLAELNRNIATCAEIINQLRYRPIRRLANEFESSRTLWHRTMSEAGGWSVNDLQNIAKAEADKCTEERIPTVAICPLVRWGGSLA
ncbi:hypothetical protein BC938DRAFT_480962 [Jimgerdemannia flammicorona]|uniref:Uncharacterized protein n=1 Tax=Jimgerdemannia flammicorona TaxID=994334 RepID=A0A433QHA3_9FUNG|nr:hypothetical protein BC938DRAFT_480962 [Jimgerdemannia flammicorona]